MSSRWREWLNDYQRVSSWMQRYGLDKLLDASGGLTRIENFFPAHVANGLLDTLRRIPTDRWTVTEATRDASYNNIDHRFLSLKQGYRLDEVFRALALLRPDEFHTFSAARYDSSHHIDPHDDQQYTTVMQDNGELVLCSRTVALIYYLTPDWREEYGGVLIDCETNTRYVPLFNSLVAFRVPRMHAVTAVADSPLPRFSLFGWFLRPGQLYSLESAEAAVAAQDEPRRVTSLTDTDNDTKRSSRKHSRTDDDDDGAAASSTLSAVRPRRRRPRGVIRPLRPGAPVARTAAFPRYDTPQLVVYGLRVRGRAAHWQKGNNVDGESGDDREV